MGARTVDDGAAANSTNPESTQTMRRSVVSASVWATAGFGLGQVLRLGGNIILAAILFQEAFALMAIASAILQGLAMFSDLGLGPSVVQNRRGDERDFLDSAWTLQVIRGVFLTLISFALAWPLASFYAVNDPAAWELRWLLPLVTASTLIQGFASSKLMSATRHMNLKRLTSIDLLAQVTSLTVMITAAWITKSVYSLAIGNVAGALLHCTLSHVALPGVRNRFRLEPTAVREIIHFGKWVFLSTLITFFAMQIDKLTFARMFPLDQVGVYAIAASLAVLTPTLMGRLQTMIAFPLYARMQDKEDALQTIVRQSKFPMLTFAGYLVALSIAGAQSFIDFAYDARYAAAGIYIPILAAGAWFAVIDGIYGAAFLATGRARWVALVNGVKVTAFCLLLVPAAHMGGLLGAVVAVAASDFIKLGVALSRARTIGLRDQFPDAIFTLYTAGAGVGVYWLTMRSTLFEAWPPLALLATQFVLVTLAFFPRLLSVARSVLGARPVVPNPESAA